MIYKFEIKRTVLEDCTPVRIERSEEAIGYLRGKVYDRNGMWREKLYAVFLDSGNRVIGHQLVCEGGTDCVTIDKKMIAKCALDVLAGAVILTHNHPSGNPQPSNADCKVTAEIREALNTLDIRLLDHIILCEDRYYSFSDEKTHLS